MGLLNNLIDRFKVTEDDMRMQLRFLGAAENVTGSRHLLEFNGSKVLMDCGLYQERDLRERNWQNFGFDPSELKCVLLSHAHLDHCGLLPKLVKEGFRGKVYCTHATAEIAEIVLMDSGKIQEEDAEFKRKRHKREGREGQKKVEPLYTMQEAQEAMRYFAPVPMEQPLRIADGIEVSFHEAGHIFGSSIIRIKVSLNDEVRTILYTGDLGRVGKPILRNPAQFEQADYVLVEATYGDQEHHGLDNVMGELERVINQTWRAGGNILIPSFSIERSQELLYYMNELLKQDRIPHIMTFVDSPMAVKVTEVFKKHPELYDEQMANLILHNESPFSFKGLKLVQSTKESKAINHIRGTVIVIAGSGMCTGGRIKHHLVNNIARPESTVLFVGYQAVGTLGRLLVDGEKEVRILGQKYPVRAKIVRAHGFSAHADRKEILTWLSSLKQPPRKIFAVHGEKEAAAALKTYLHEKTGWDVVVPQFQDIVEVD
jgi:metallo-beta-lactamase family protein